MKSNNTSHFKKGFNCVVDFVLRHKHSKLILKHCNYSVGYCKSDLSQNWSITTVWITKWSMWNRLILFLINCVKISFNKCHQIFRQWRMVSGAFIKSVIWARDALRILGLNVSNPGLFYDTHGRYTSDIIQKPGKLEGN